MVQGKKTIISGIGEIVYPRWVGGSSGSTTNQPQLEETIYNPNINKSFKVSGEILRKYKEKQSDIGYPISEKMKDEYQYFERAVLYSIDNFQNTHVFYQDNSGKYINYDDKFLSEIFVPYQKQKLSKEIVLLESELQFREMLLYQMEILQNDLKSSIEQQKQDLSASILGMISLLTGSKKIEKIETTYDMARGDFVSVVISLFTSRIEDGVSYFKQNAKSLEHSAEALKLIGRTKVLRLFIEDIDVYSPYLSRYIRGEKDFNKLLDFYNKNGKNGLESIKMLLEHPKMNPKFIGKLGDIAKSEIDTYSELTRLINDGDKIPKKDLLGIQVHHLIEERFATKGLGIRLEDVDTKIPAITLKNEDHQKYFTNEFAKRIKKEGQKDFIPYNEISKSEYIKYLKEIYQDYPEIYKSLEIFFKNDYPDLYKLWFQ
jgi:hypothetical protein